jgi:hypothetical protein
MNKVFLYLKGLILALCGKYPHEELEHLDFIKVKLTTDYQWLMGLPYARHVVKRHNDFVDSNYKSILHQGIFEFREELISIYAVVSKNTISDSDHKK